MRAPPRNVLLVEGQTDLRVVPELIEQNGYPWLAGKNPIVWIKASGGDTLLLDKDVLSAELKQSGLQALGVMLDADDSAAARWQAIRSWASDVLGDLPEQLPAEGLVTQIAEGPRFGVWLMPDNRAAGMMETFLTWLCPQDSDLFKHAATARDEAKRLGAPYKDAHADKALIHTWLAWQDEPGHQLHQAIKYRVLRADSPASAPFVAWFARLYQLTLPPPAPSPP